MSDQITVRTKDQSPVSDNRPWGSFTVLDEGRGYKVKRIEVLPGKCLSYHRHANRSKLWMIVGGASKVTLDVFVQIVHSGEIVRVPARTAHRIENPCAEKLIFIEIQRGDYLVEDDIVRLQDDFGRIL